MRKRPDDLLTQYMKPMRRIGGQGTRHFARDSWTSLETA